MTTHQYPAVSHPHVQQDREHIVSSLNAYLLQREIDAGNWQSQAEQHEKSLERLRGELASAQAALATEHTARLALERALGEAWVVLNDILQSEALCNCGPYFSQGETFEKRIRSLLANATSEAGQ